MSKSTLTTFLVFPHRILVFLLLHFASTAAKNINLATNIEDNSVKLPIIQKLKLTRDEFNHSIF